MNLTRNEERKGNESQSSSAVYLMQHHQNLQITEHLSSEHQHMETTDGSGI